MMKRRVVLLAVVLMVTVLCGFGSTRSTRPHKARAHKKDPRIINAQNKFHFAPTTGRGAEWMQRWEAARQRPMTVTAHATKARAATRVKRRSTKPVPPTSTVGFVTATQIPAGGYIGYEVLPGDFDGNGITDFVAIAGDPANPGNFSLAVVLSNGNGTFAQAQLTAVPGPAPFAVGDVNSDGMDDVIFVHQAGGGASASFDVMLSNGDGTFSFLQNFAITANSLSGGALVDFDGDGNLDVVVVDAATPGNVWVLTGDGLGSFNAPSSIPLLDATGYDVEVADLNGDGMVDLTWSDSSLGAQVVVLATSLTSYAAGVQYFTSDGLMDACSTSIGDLNGDGIPEILSANCTDNTITIYVNDGAGGFGGGGTYYPAGVGPAGTAGVDPMSVAVGDVNGDGFPDVISTNDYSGDVTVLLGNGDGTVSSPSHGYAVGGYPSRPAMVADLNGDGLMDIVVPDDNYSLVYMPGYGDGTFRTAVNYYAPGLATGSSSLSLDVATGDFNGDGLADVVTGNCCDASQGITVFLSRPDGSLMPGVNYGSGGGMHYVAVADFNGDGILDIAATDTLNGWVQVFLGHDNGSGVGDGTFTAESTTYATDTSSTTKPDAIVVADFNGDGSPDLAVVNALGSNIGVLLNTADGTGSFGPPANYPTCSAGSQVSVGDLDGDGSPDLVMPMPACTGVAIYLNDGTGTNFNAQPYLAVGYSPYQVAVGDLNGDGFNDLAITMDDFINGQGMSVALNVGDGTGTFNPVNTPGYPVSLQSNYFSPKPSYVRLVDLDGDGFLDAVYTNTNYGTVGVLYNTADGTGSFFDPVEYPTGRQVFGLALGDVDGDGTMDVVTAGNYTSGAAVLINNSGTGALPDYSVAANPTTQSVTAGGSTTYVFTLTPRNFYNGTVTFSCGTLPSKTTCSFDNPTLTPNGNAVMTTTLTVTTVATTTTMLLAPADVNPHGGATTLFASFAGMGFFGLVFVVAADWKKKSIRRVGILLMVVALTMLVTLVGCGGSSPPPVTHTTIPGTPTGSYPITVTATGTAGTNGGNTAAHPVAITLNVN